MFVKLLDFLEPHVPWLVGLSVVSLLVGALLVPAMIVRIPPDYFLADRRRPLSNRSGRPAARWLLVAGKNFLGALLLLVGIALLFLPGQGLLTLMAGLMIMNYPGKYGFERWIVRRPHVLAALNWLRARHGREPLAAP